MSDFGNGKWVEGRKTHQCAACLGPIPKGERHYHYVGVYEGEWQNWRMHRECFEDYDASGEGEFVMGETEMPERMRAILRSGEESHG